MTKLKDTEQAVEELKGLAELLYSTPESKLVDEYEKFEYFERQLNALLATVAKYRFQLDSSEDKVIFGPKTLKTVESVVFNYDKLYEIYEDHLLNTFNAVKPLYDKMKRSAKKENDEDEEEQLKSINEETKSQLKKISEMNERKKMREQSEFREVDFESIQKNETELKTMFNEILEIYKGDACDDLARVVGEVYEAHGEEFETIVENVAHLLREIARKPDEVSLRILRIGNEKLQKDFLEHVNSVKILKYAGFRIATTAEVEKHLKELKIKFEDEYFLYLNEPDMFSQYNKWKAWLDHINAVHTKLEQFLKNYKQLKRTGVDAKLLIARSLM